MKQSEYLKQAAQRVAARYITKTKTAGDPYRDATQLGEAVMEAALLLQKDVPTKGALSAWKEVGMNLIRLGSTTPQEGWPEEERMDIKDDIRGHLKAGTKDRSMTRAQGALGVLQPEHIIRVLQGVRG